VVTDRELDDYLARKAMGWQRVGKEWFDLHGRVVSAVEWRPTRNAEQTAQVINAVSDRGLTIVLHIGRATPLCPRSVCDAARTMLGK